MIKGQPICLPDYCRRNRAKQSETDEEKKKKKKEPKIFNNLNFADSETIYSNTGVVVSAWQDHKKCVLIASNFDNHRPTPVLRKNPKSNEDENVSMPDVNYLVFTFSVSALVFLRY